jgi:hypothetical protein
MKTQTLEFEKTLPEFKEILPLLIKFLLKLGILKLEIKLEIELKYILTSVLIQIFKLSHDW